MTSKIDQAIKEVRKLPRKRQDEIADILSAMSAEVPTSSELLAAIDEGIADADAGHFADPTAVAALFARFRRA